ncbi:MAG TPA: YecA family protein [Gammaproteobacteria bacterium]|nr:YecA family protein [Gammaproteobacteria bacterium]
MSALCNNCTMPENQRLEYYDVADTLDRASLLVDAADCHGFLSGLVCASGFADPKIWVAEIFEDYNPKNTRQAEAYRQLQALYEATVSGLNSHEIDFELLLPDDAESLRERAGSLGSWCSGFLSGLGMGGLPAQDRLPDDVRELLRDLSEISRVDFELDQPGEDELAAFEEVVEYIRVGVLFLHDELQPPNAPSQVQ